MKSKKTKRILSWILTLAMVLAMLPTAVFAADTVTVSNEEALVSAVSNAAAGDTIKLSENITLTGVLQIPENKKFTLDLNKCSITQTTEGVNAINLSSGDNVTITGTGTITGNNNGIYVPSGAELTINGGEIRGEWSAVWNEGTLNVGGTANLKDGENYGVNCRNNSILNMTGGTISYIYNNEEPFNYNYVANISGGIINGNAVVSSITGGTFKNVTLNGSSKISNAIINGTFNWNGDTVPILENITFGDKAKVGKEGYKFNSSKTGIDKIDYVTFKLNPPVEGGKYSVASLKWNTESIVAGSSVDNYPYTNAKVASGDQYTIIATVTANDGYTFDGWYLNDAKLEEGVDDNGTLKYTFAVSENTMLTAKFISLELDKKAKNCFKDYDTTTEYTISTIDDMDLFAYAVTNLGYDFSGKTIKLGADLDFADKTYRVIGDRTHAFKGTFDAKKSETENYTICNISKIADGGFVGLFGNINAATVQNLTLSNCEFNASTSGYAGGIAAEATSSMIKNCKVTNMTTSGWFSGAVVGHTFDGVTIDNVTVESCTASGSKAGNVVGYSDSITIKGVNVSDVKDGAALIGHANAGTNVIENVTVNAPDAVLIGMTYSESNGSVTIKGENTNIEAKKVIDETDTKKPIILEEGKITVSEPTTVTGGSTIMIGNNAKITVEGGKAFANLEEGAKVDKIDSDGKKTTVTVGESGGSVDNNANLIIPAGSTVGDKTVKNDAVMTPNGTVIEGNGTNAPTVNDDGSITVPAGGKVTEKDGTETTLNNGGSVTSSNNVDKVTPTPSPSFGGSSNTADNVVNKPEDKNTNTAASTTATIKGTAADGTITATVDDATADKIVEKAVENKSEKVIIDAVTGTAGTRCEVSIPEKTVQALAEKTEAGITIKSDTAEVTFDKKAVDALAAQAGTTGMVKLIAEIVAQDENKLQVELKLITSRGTVSDFKGGNVSVTVKPNDKLAAKDIVCVHIDDNGACHIVDGVKNADGTYSFNTGHFSSYVIMVRDEAEKIMTEQAAELTAALQLKARSAKTAKGSIKVTLAVTKGDIKAIEDLGYTVKYKFYRSKSKTKSYKAKIEGAGKTYINNSGKKGTKYYYKARVMVYDAQGKLIAKTELKQCRYACRIK